MRQSGKVIGHYHDLYLKDAKYLVSEAGRKRVLKEKKKNVHAGVSGFVVDRAPLTSILMESVTMSMIALALTMLVVFAMEAGLNNIMIVMEIVSMI